MSEALLPFPLSQKIQEAITSIRQHHGAVVALSAGVDSSLVALLAKRALGDLSVAITAVSETLPPGELEIATNTAAGIGIKHLIVHTDELHNPDYASNTSNRCFYCKDTLYAELTSIASELGFEAVLDGTQADDVTDDRPGFQAAKNFGVKSPLLEASFSKYEVREAARILGLSIWDKPAMPCLSSRITHGEQVTEAKLSMVGEAELFIKKLTGVRELRVRYQNREARIEVSPEERHLFFDEAIMGTVDEHLRAIGFSTVTLDLRGYRRRKIVNPEPSEVILPMAGTSTN
jgi:pyridinium-3,5-biscarboxylic acid mononucleotide sulfurtransferase